MNTTALPSPPTATSPPSWHTKVARAFSRAAPHYDALASAQRQMGETLWATLPDTAGLNMLDIGCGTGYWTQRLATRYPNARVTGLDIAPGMLAHAQSRYGNLIRWQLGNAEALPFATATFNMVFSNLAIQWCRDIDAVMDELQRVLVPGGQAYLATLLPGTLAEVATAWQRPEALLETPSQDQLACAVNTSGLTLVHQRAERRTFFYPDLSAVMASIKGVGAQVARPNARLTRGELTAARARFETLREPQGLPVSYQCLTLHLEKSS
ncbi:methyltransferase domain-containing protein [Halomonas sp. HL-93]|uniref:methyltransferase domain-containing protein n=1 Tax=Halomonas sp. HL-93 TaxID=1666906 RepID=UPI0006D94C83|nr:methyltransferase domain-containing protein [Halomonas sp. HL-93]KPQ20832.1 MAG: malonyl-CoA O-methyltransferase BioC [Halomonas sp. HL-93]SBR51200.1 malonyl-CoA O-methyltransferase [Halomonas sp. HL-93]